MTARWRAPAAPGHEPACAALRAILPAPAPPRHQDRPENAPTANTGPRNAITAAVAVPHRTAASYDLWIADNASPDYHG